MSVGRTIQPELAVRDATTRANVTCIWWSAEGDGGPTLDPSQMRILAALNLECAFEFAYFGPEESAGKPTGQT